LICKEKLDSKRETQKALQNLKMILGWLQI